VCGAFGPKVPSNNMFITPAHPICVNGKEYKSHELIDHRNVMVGNISQPQTVYTLLTRRRTCFMAEGMLVYTYGKTHADWKHIKRIKSLYTLL
jgi:hypothetical protein